MPRSPATAPAKWGVRPLTSREVAERRLFPERGLRCSFQGSVSPLPGCRSPRGLRADGTRRLRGWGCWGCSSDAPIGRAIQARFRVCSRPWAREVLGYAGYMPRWIAFVALDRDLLALERLRGTVATCDALWLQHCGYMHTRSEKSGAMSPWRLGGRRECRADGTRACGG
jgi:hypothetical protein